MDLEALFANIKKERGGLANIHLAFSDFPDGIKAHYDFYKAIILQEGLPLSRSEREYLAVATSKANSCPYCISHHEEALQNCNIELSENKKLALEKLATVLTKEPWRSSSLQAEFLDSGFDASRWQHAVMVVAYFNFANRCAHAQGLEPEEDYKKTCK